MSDDRARRGLTLVELIMGLALTLLIAGAAAGLSLAAAKGWRDAEAMDAVAGSARQAVLNLQGMLREARYVGLAASDGQEVLASVTADPLATTPTAAAGAGATVLLWAEDDGDGVMQLRELRLVQREPATRTLWIYSVPSTAPNAGDPFRAADIVDTSDAEAFKLIPTVSRRALARGVAGLNVSARTAQEGLAKRQALELTLRVRRAEAAQDAAADGAVEVSRYATVALRAYKEPAQP